MIAHALKVQFSSSPVPLNRRLTIAPVERECGFRGFYSNRKKVGYEMVLTAEYRRWLREQVSILHLTRTQAGFKTIDRPCVCLVVWSRPKNGRKHDIDGVLKGPFDALTQAQVIKDDHLISASMIVTLPPKNKGSMYLLIQELDEDSETAQFKTLCALFNLAMGTQNA